MAHDFAKTRARKAAPEQSRTEPAPQPTKGMLITGLLTGLVLGFFSFFLVYLTGILPPVDSILSDAANPANPDELAAAQQRRTEELELAAARLQLEFYKELPNYEVIVDNSPQPRSTSSSANTLTATATAIANIAANAAANAAATVIPSAEPTAAADSVPIEDTARPVAQADTPAPRPGEPSFMVQAGAFQQEAAAVAQSMRLSALGLDARVKKEALLGKTLFLVQAGPYYSRDELNQAERLLRTNSIDSMRIGVSP
ncbi:MAG: SPOR domain-containing protein [Gammaproteobacteria bacterium]|nr:SPOR domain-containing protein [Gammaproteobacteria bacterium]MDP2139895.1 SPOR domain-containing protein [Gammaproteobacteria bacterium]MDP2347715.1 SPOR domain-containing protein [Gammaproteobacteria bacterium]